MIPYFIASQLKRHAFSGHYSQTQVAILQMHAATGPGLGNPISSESTKRQCMRPACKMHSICPVIEYGHATWAGRTVLRPIAIPCGERRGSGGAANSAWKGRCSEPEALLRGAMTLKDAPALDAIRLLDNRRAPLVRIDPLLSLYCSSEHPFRGRHLMVYSISRHDSPTSAS